MTEFLNHLNVILHTFFDTLCLDVIPYLGEEINLLHQVILYLTNGSFGLFLRRNKEIGWVNLVSIEGSKAMEINSIHLLDRIYLIIPPRNTQDIVVISHCNIHRITLHTEVSTL